MRTDTDRFKTILALELFDGLEGVEKSLFEYQLDQAMAMTMNFRTSSEITPGRFIM